MYIDVLIVFCVKKNPNAPKSVIHYFFIVVICI